MEAYAPKSCKFNVLPHSLGSRAYTSYTGEIRVHDVFGIPSTVKRHVVRLDLTGASLLTLQAEVHRDTPTTLTVDAYRRGEVGSSSGRILYGKNMLGAGGEDTKAFLHGLIDEKNKEVDIVFELISVEVARSQVDGRVAETKCWPIRLDLTAIQQARAAMHWPQSCPAQSRLPPPLGVGGAQVVSLTDLPLELKPEFSQAMHFSWKFGDERPWTGFERSLWDGIIEVPTRLHRFVRFFIRATFHFASGPLQLVIELFDLKDSPDGTALSPSCKMGCLGGVPVYNGQVVDHAMPTGFRYRLWLLAGGMPEWTAAVPDKGRHCLEFDLDYSIAFESRMTPFEVGPSAWLCESTRLPEKIIQSAQSLSTDRLVEAEDMVTGRTIWIRDRFGFPPGEIDNMEHEIEIEVAEPCIFRATTHHSDGVDVFLALKKKDDPTGARACQTLKHPGPVPRQTVFCALQPGMYVLVFFADFPLGGLHPCSDFFAQVALRPVALADDEGTRQCVRAASDLTSLAVHRRPSLTDNLNRPRWKQLRVPINFEAVPTHVNVWTQAVTVSEEDAKQRLYLRLVVHSDFVSSDLRFQVLYEGKYVADTQVTAHGYADMIGPLDAGTYTVELYYVSGTNGPSDMKLCSVSMVDLRFASRSAYENSTSQWLCESTRVPPPELLQPQPDEQILIDSEYVVPRHNIHFMSLQLKETRLLRVQTNSADADFQIVLSQERGGGSSSEVAKGDGHLEVLLGPGSYNLKLSSSIHGTGSAARCSTFTLTLLLTPKVALPLCPWASGSSDRSGATEAQRVASDHIGNVLLDLVPKHLTQELSVPPPVHLWMSQGMEKSFEMQVDETAALRLDIVMHPPFLPLEVVLRRKRASGKLEAPIAKADWLENRLLLMYSDLPRGTYIVEFSQPRKYTVVEATEQELLDLCAHVTIRAEAGVASKEAVNTMRSELLDLPDLLAVQPFPPSLNTIGWFSSSLVPAVGTQVYKLTDKVSASLRVDDRAVLRLVCEPADLSNSEIQAQILQDGSAVGTSDSLGQLAVEVQAGSYQLNLKPKAAGPFLVTVGLASATRLKDDYSLLDSGKPCLDKMPEISSGMEFSAHGWTIGPKTIRLNPGFLSVEKLAKIPIRIVAPSILYIESGSALPLDLVRIALQVPEGLWIGEQRGARNSLEIELPAGNYQVHLGQPKPLGSHSFVGHCLEFSVHITATPLNPDAAADSAEAAAAQAAKAGTSPQDGDTPQELAPREEAAIEAAPCFEMGASPLPLDLSDPSGGSGRLGGPLDKDGRLLIREKVMLTDMHDGRKKVYLSTRGKKLQLKVGVFLGGYSRLSSASQLNFEIVQSGTKVPLTPVETWWSAEGWERVYLLDGPGFWLTFHHGHRERSESACLQFGLELEAHPVQDIPRMLQCQPLDASDEGSSDKMEDKFPEWAGVPPETGQTFIYEGGSDFVKQEQNGFLRKVKFSLKSVSHVAAEFGYNFFLSHAEMDIVHASDPNSHSPIASAEPAWINSAIKPINTQLTIYKTLQPGDYMLRAADDHYASQVDSTACFPITFTLRIVAAHVGPMVVSVLPRASVPLVRGMDLVLTIRFSEPPAGSLEEVVQQISLGDVGAMTGGSMSSMQSDYTSKKRTTVQVTSAEDDHVWVIAFAASALEGMNKAQLSFGQLKGNVSKKKYFVHDAPEYHIPDVIPKTPWFGDHPEKKHHKKSEADTPAPGGGISSIFSSISGGSSAQAKPPQAEKPAGSDDDGDDDDDEDKKELDEDDGLPTVEEWHPTDTDGGLVHRRRSSGATTSAPATAGSDSNGSSMLPTGYQVVYLAVAMGVGYFVYVNYYQRGAKSARSPAARFRDIGERTTEEEIGLVQRVGRHHDEDDDDML